ncbi:DUF7344 domain-containing protein [Halorarius litoreus]|uniref:DUF7344 domain-containing protein n=1 Tax=Halorarius litoreus TaxID=2962676 RepID=UPI0020CE25B4|nr:hypothetical protein [Halorarius litoreus]
MSSDTTPNLLTQLQRDETEYASRTESTEHQQPERGGPDELPISLDNVFGILSNERRRHVLWFLAEQDGPVSLRELSEYVAAIENDKPVAQLSSQERKRVYVGLYQGHLPKMDDLSFIEYNKDRGIIELGPHAVHTAPYLQPTDTTGDQWPMYYLGSLGVGWLLLLAGSVVSPLATLVAIGVFLTLMTSLAVAHVVRLRREPAGPRFDAPL